jgi:hypothetical protein
VRRWLAVSLPAEVRDGAARRGLSLSTGPVYLGESGSRDANSGGNAGNSVIATHRMDQNPPHNWSQP